MNQNIVPRYFPFLKRNIFKQFFKFSIVGILNTFIGLGTILILYNIYSVNYVLANVVGYILGLINSFIWNKKWTFKSKGPFSKEIIPFLITFIISYFANLVSVIFIVEVLKINPNISQVISMGIYTAVNFILNRKWTFSAIK